MSDVVPMTPIVVDPAEAAGQQATGSPETWHLRLYVAGESPKSLEAFTNLTRLCDSHLADRYEIEVVDLLENPRLARRD